jgi:hypothetical protein
MVGILPGRNVAYPCVFTFASSPVRKAPASAFGHAGSSALLAHQGNGAAVEKDPQINWVAGNKID